jgi:hypothetical protein
VCDILSGNTPITSPTARAAEVWRNISAWKMLLFGGNGDEELLELL